MIETTVIWLAFGILVGLLSAAIDNREPRLKLRYYLLFGVVGAVIAGYVYSFFSKTNQNYFDMKSTFVSILGAAIIVNFVRSYQENERR